MIDPTASAGLRPPAWGPRPPAGVRRTCGACTACCAAPRIEDGESGTVKPPGVPCRMLRAAGEVPGCRDYDRRPGACRAFECLWRQAGEALGGEDRPDRCGVLLIYRMASRIGLPPRGGSDWMVAVALPAAGRATIADYPEAMETIRRLRCLGLHVLLDERSAGWRAVLDNPLRPPTREFVARLEAAMIGQGVKDQQGDGR